MMPMYDLSMMVGLIFAGLAGLLLGAFFFGSLWWTVRRTLSSSSSVLWHIGSLLVRMGITLLGFYVVGATSWERLLICLVGFLIARFAITWMTRNWLQRQCHPTHPTEEAGHAP